MGIRWRLEGFGNDDGSVWVSEGKQILSMRYGYAVKRRIVVLTRLLFQQRSVAQMLLQESYPERFRDIKFVQVQETGRDGTYYVDLRTGEVRREEDVGFYEVPRGGIL
jgi:hypothetical protein